MRLRVLVLDHYFGQDLDALGADPGLELRRIPFQRWRRPALRIMGPAVGTGLEEYTRPELAEARHRFAGWLAGDLRRLYLEQAFDVVVLPSDLFFYVRALPEAAHAIGVPVVVVQKETTISPATLTAHSQSVARSAPFISDRMTVCSERQREFWVRAGSDPDQIVVTGQPRFDLYAAPRPANGDQVRTVLFLSYELDAYQPGVGGGQGLRTWEPLRSLTEEVLLRVASKPGWRVVVKGHPQQNRVGEQDRLRVLAGSHWDGSFTMADPESDIRLLFRAADCVVGFQTTALYESVAAGLPTIYAAWGPEFERHREGLIPFDATPCVLRAADPDDLERLILGDNQRPVSESCHEWFEEGLGPVDGHATERVASVLHEVAAEWPPGRTRQRLDASRRWWAVRFLVEAAAVESVWSAARLPARWTGHEAGVELRRHQAAEHRRLALRSLAVPRG